MNQREPAEMHDARLAARARGTWVIALTVTFPFPSIPALACYLLAPHSTDPSPLLSTDFPCSPTPFPSSSYITGCLCWHSYLLTLVHRSWISYTLKMEAIRSSETSVNTISTRRHIPEDDILHSHRRQNLKSYNRKTCFLRGRSGSYITTDTNIAVSVFVSECSDIQVSRKLEERIETSGTEDYKRSACEDVLCELEDSACVIVQRILGMRNSMRLVWFPCYEYVKTAADRVKRLACSDCKLCK
jgi:hypothetical protein